MKNQASRKRNQVVRRTCPCLIRAIADRGLKVCLMPCLGLEDAIGTAVRQACYIVAEKLRPKVTVLGCAPALFVGAEEDVIYVLSYPVVAIEACPYACGSRMCQRYGKEPDAVIYAHEFFRQAGIDLSGESNYILGEIGQRAAELLAEKIVETVDNLLLSEVRKVAKVSSEQRAKGSIKSG
ncbi:MAG: putative zinc-binding protein [Armatimonadota bacterium]|nr:putative zinc-binding protein [Armatimonadota bacterium]MCX7777770.1 putative zinc-binding protein [Armatimonadota bacterium]MDW8025343.1 putative zinc-binding protein [Armatimonadota bacterium]